MIISHKYKFIFIHINKCGGTSITRALFPYLDKSDLILGGLPKFEKKSREYKQKHRIYKHSTSSQIRQFIGDDIWSSYYKFAFVRNPWSKILSNYLWFHKQSTFSKILKVKGNNILKMKDFSEYVKSKYLDEAKSCSDFIYDDNKQLLVDFYGKQESLERDFAYVCGKLGLPLITLNQENQTNHNKYQNYYDEETQKIIANRYAQDINNFGYKFNN